MGKAIIDEETLTGIADAIRTRKGTSGLISTPNMKDEILSISGGGSVIENSFTVNFHDVNKNLIETHTAKVGNLIGKPLSLNSAWRGSDETAYYFPITCEVSQIIDVYAYNETIAEKIYENYNIDSSVYPYLTIDILNNSIYLTFSKSVNAVTSNQFETIDCYAGQAYGIGSAVNIDEIENVLYEKIGSGSLTYTSSLSWDSNIGAYYLNYDTPTSEFLATVYDLRQ